MTAPTPNPAPAPAVKPAAPKPAPKALRRLFLIAGHGGKDPGAGAHGHREADLTRRQRDLVRDWLLALGVPADRILTDSDNWDFVGTLAQIKAQARPDDILIDLHFNAATPAARGVEAYVKVQHTAADRALADALCAVVAARLGTPNRKTRLENQTRHGRLGVLHCGPGTNVLLETEFITNLAGISTYMQHENAVAEEIAKCVLPLLNA